MRAFGIENDVYAADDCGKAVGQCRCGAAEGYGRAGGECVGTDDNAGDGWEGDGVWILKWLVRGKNRVGRAWGYL